MARIRSIKPDFFTSEKVAALPLSTRLTFIGLWTHVDDNGVATDNDKLINAAIWPLEEDPRESLLRTREDLRRLSEARLIVRYKAHGKALLFILNWDEHQKVSHPAKPRYVRPTPEQVREAFTPATSENAHPSTSFGQDSGEAPEDLASPPEIFGPEQGAGSREQGKETTSSDASRPDVERVCAHLADRIEGNGSNRPKIGKGWRDEARLMIDKDGRSEEQIHSAIDWCQDSTFWRGNVMSIPKLREKYDQLRLAAANPGNAQAHHAAPPTPKTYTDEDYRAGFKKPANG